MNAKGCFPFFALLATLCAAQDPWADAQTALGIRARANGRWVVATAPERMDPYAPMAQRLVTSRGCMMELLPSEAGEALRARWGLPGEAPVWALVSPEGRLTDQGKGLLTPDSLLSLLKAQGYVPPWEQVEAFLRDHPDHGDARLEALRQALNLAHAAIPLLRKTQAQGPERARAEREALEPVRAALAPILDLPAWQATPRLAQDLARLTRWDLTLHPELRSLLIQVFRELVAWEAARPHAAWEHLGILHLGVGLGLSMEEWGPWMQPLTAMDSFIGGMGIEGIASQFGWEKTLEALDTYVSLGPLKDSSPKAWEAHCDRKASLLFNRVECLFHLRRWEACASALGELRAWSGPRWPDVAKVLRFVLHGIEEGAMSRLEPLLALSPLPAPAPPALAPKASTPDSPAEIFRRLDQEVASRPQDLGLRGARLEAWFAAQRPASRENLAAEDARLAPFSLPEAAGWKPPADLWRPQAARVLPALERELVAWPSRAPLWRTWVRWAALHPGKPSLANLLHRAVPFGDPGEWRASLPKEVHRALAAELRSAQKFEAMQTWFAPAFKAASEAMAVDLTQPATRPQRLQALHDTFASPLKEALLALGRTREFKELETAFGRLKDTALGGTR